MTPWAWRSSRCRSTPGLPRYRPSRKPALESLVRFLKPSSVAASSVRWLRSILPSRTVRSSTKYASSPRTGLTPLALQALYSSTEPFMTPWSVRPRAGWPRAAARSASALMFAAPSSNEYSEWTCRCAQAGVLTGPPKIGARSDGAAALPAPSGECRSQPLGAVQPALQEGDHGAVPADHGTMAGRGGLAAEEVPERLGRHGHRGVRTALGRCAADVHAAAVADGDVPRLGRVARDLLRDGERVVARPPAIDRVRDGAEDERGLDPPARPRDLR